MTTVFEDTFETALDLTTLWEDEASPQVYSTSGGLLLSSTANFRVLKTRTGAHAAIGDCLVEMVRGSATFDASICARCSIAGAISNSGSTYWLNVYGTDIFEITRRVGATTTLLATRNSTHANGDKFGLRVTGVDPVVLTAFHNDVQLGASHNDSAVTRIQDPGRTGVFVFNANSRFASFRVDDLQLAGAVMRNRSQGNLQSLSGNMRG